MLRLLASATESPTSIDPRRSLHIPLPPQSPSQRQSNFQQARSHLDAFFRAKSTSDDFSDVLPSITASSDVSSLLSTCSAALKGAQTRQESEIAQDVEKAETALNFVSEISQTHFTQFTASLKSLEASLEPPRAFPELSRRKLKVEQVSKYLGSVSRALELTEELREVGERELVKAEHVGMFMELRELLKEQVNKDSNAYRVLIERFGIVKGKITKNLQNFLEEELGEDARKWPGEVPVSGGEESGGMEGRVAERVVWLQKVDAEKATETLAEPLVRRFLELFRQGPLNRRDRPDWPIKHMKEQIYAPAVRSLEKAFAELGREGDLEVVEKLGMKLIEELRKYFRIRLEEISEEEMSGYFSTFLTEFDFDDLIFFADFKVNFNGFTAKLAAGDVRLLEPRLTADLAEVAGLFELAIPRVQAAGPLLEQAYEKLVTDPMKGVERKLKDKWNAIPSLDRVEEVSKQINEVEAAAEHFARLGRFPAVKQALERLHENMVDRVADFLLSGGKDAVWGKKKHEEFLAALQDEYLARLNSSSRSLLADFLSQQ